MSNDSSLNDRISKLEKEVAGQKAQLEHIANMITRYGVNGPGPAEDEEALLERVDSLEAEVRSISQS